MRPVRADIDLDAIAANVATLAARAPRAELCAVVKADGYGHGAVPVARAAVGAGVRWLAVATVEEGAELRAGGLGGRVLLLSEPPPDSFTEVVRLGLTPVVYSVAGIEAAATAAATEGSDLAVHLKLNTGMNRVGCETHEALDRVARIRAHRSLVLEGLLTHFAVADDPTPEGDAFTRAQAEDLEAVVTALDGEGHRPPIVHAANSAATLRHPSTHHDLVRCGIALYGIAPTAELRDAVPLAPALRLRAEVTLVRTLAEGERVSYGLHHRCDRPTLAATVPIGYADGVPRSLSGVGGQVLVGGRRCPIIGAITMDQLVVDLGAPGGPGSQVAVGDEVVLLGGQGSERIDPWEWAEALDTIAYEIVCRIGPRVPRHYSGGP